MVSPSILWYISLVDDILLSYVISLFTICYCLLLFVFPLLYLHLFSQCLHGRLCHLFVIVHFYSFTSQPFSYTIHSLSPYSCSVKYSLPLSSWYSSNMFVYVLSSVLSVIRSLHYIGTEQWCCSLVKFTIGETKLVSCIPTIFVVHLILY